MKNVLVISFTDLKKDARVMRQVNFLKGDYRVTVAAMGAPPDQQYRLIHIQKTELTFLRKATSAFFLLLGIHDIAYRILHDYNRYVLSLQNLDFDLILANDIETLPFAFKVAGNKSKIFFDAHEYAPRQFEDRLYWRIFFKRFNSYLTRKYLPVVHGMSTINGSLAEAYETNYGVKPVIVTNAAEYFEYVPVERFEYPIRLVHHGIFTVSRQPEIMLDMADLLDDRFTLDLIYMMPESSSGKTRQHFEQLRTRAAGSKKIKILPALKPHEIVPCLHERYDMGIILIPPVNFNYENGLPNKLFDCIQARMAMGVGPLKEIARITRQYQIGIVSDDFTARGMADALNALTLEHLNTFKRNTSRAALEMSATHNKEVLLTAIKAII
jgi:hypothetical protein